METSCAVQYEKISYAEKEGEFLKKHFLLHNRVQVRREMGPLSEYNDKTWINLFLLPVLFRSFYRSP